MFVHLTHSHSGEKILIRADEIHTIRVKEGRTLVIGKRGYYVNEDPYLVEQLVEAVVSSMHTITIGEGERIE
ncbi:hypothetical protein M5X02_31625 [Paenibacillus alvei]|uniref:hypothetical protein n=1 Tax=Paenibacillus alvei TaxID=44250 RepID=UPI000288FF6F|nr:hypothetical protein [Paenibacillus alvei]EJW13966.1 hypothetical protein PAV_141p00720 [Paenibacillus alvei DSM 29]MCY9545179.1 hypothetical protein [Paenibacillus alvei]MCY9707672.1 hypothetical protein [Paenibacillus alvei]MEC0082816.1 hypothetical protein [Paenibacillus alvei]